MTPRRLTALAMLVATSLLTPTARAADPDPVQAAIDRGVKYLLAHQNGGTWEKLPPPAAGLNLGRRTAMATQALLAAGQPASRPELQAALDYLDHEPITGTSAYAAKVELWDHLVPNAPPMKQQLKKDAVTLMSGVNLNGPAAGFYDAQVNAPNAADLTASADAIAGMAAAARKNLEVPQAYFQLVDKAWRGAQLPTGAWAAATDPPGGSIATTAAAAHSLYTVQWALNNQKGECRGAQADPALQAALKRLAVPPAAVLADADPILAFHNLQHVSQMSGRRLIGPLDVHQAGVAHLLKAQNADGSWPDKHGDDVASTARAIRFLVDSRRPVMMNKLEYTTAGAGAKPGAWEQRPHDVRNLAAWAGRVLETPLDWQVVDLTMPDAILQESPVLFISGNQSLAFTPGEIATLRRYVEQGGLILGHADCNDPRFTASFNRLATVLFPAYGMRALPPTHPVYAAFFNLAAGPRVDGVSNGARELMLLIPSGDPGRMWQTQNFYGSAAKAQAELAANIYVYASDAKANRPRRRGQAHLIAPDPKVQAKRTLQVARLQFGGNWDPEPAGWPRLGAALHNAQATDVVATPVALGTGGLNNNFALAHLTGTGNLGLNAAQRAEIAAYVNGGGTLIIDAAGGDAAFAAAALAELAAIFPNAPAPAVLPANHAVYTAGPAAPLGPVAYRRLALKNGVGNPQLPTLQGLDINNRTAVLFSPQNLSVGLLGTEVGGIDGYAPESATGLMTRILLHAAN